MKPSKIIVFQLLLTDRARNFALLFIFYHIYCQFFFAFAFYYIGHHYL